MVRFFLAAAVLCTAGAASAAVGYRVDDGTAGLSFTEGQLPTGGPEQSFFPASPQAFWAVTEGEPLRLNDYPPLNMRPSGDVFGERYQDIRGLGFGRSQLDPMPTQIAPVPEAHEWAMIAAGMGVVGFAARRRKAAAS